MARARKKKTTTTAAVPRQRFAAPEQRLIGLTPSSASVTSLAATGVVLGAVAVGLPIAAGAAVASALVTAAGLRVKGHTLPEWARLRRGTRSPLREAALFERERAGIVFDGRTMSVCVEITPRPWQLTTITAAGECETPLISADQLRRQLVQYDIHCSRLTAINSGYKYAARSDVGASVLDSYIGPVSAPLGGTTVIVVSIDLEPDVLGPAYRRAPREADGELSLPNGLCRTTIVAATRVCHSLAEDGFGGRLMNAAQVRAFHDEVLTQVGGPLAAPGWDHCGDSDGVHTRTYSPARGHWNTESASSWNHLPSHRQYTTLTLTPQGDGRALAQPLVTYLARSRDSLASAEGYGLRPALGQQVAGVAQALPLAAVTPLRTPGAVIDEQRRLGFGIPSGGAGVFVGSRSDRSRVFVAVSPSEDPLWLCGPTLFALQMIARLSTQDRRIAVMIDDPVWEALVAHRNVPTLGWMSLNDSPADVVVTTPAWWERNRERCAGKAVVLVSADKPGAMVTHSLTVTTGPGRTSLIEVDVDDQTTAVEWQLTSHEKLTLLGDIDPDSEVVPTKGAPLVLSEIVQLPEAAVTSPAPKRTRQEIPADAVPTLEEVRPEQLLELAPVAAGAPERVKVWSTAPVVASGAPWEAPFNETVEFPSAAAPVPTTSREAQRTAETLEVSQARVETIDAPWAAQLNETVEFPGAGDVAEDAPGRHRRGEG